ncbi:MAG: maleylacetoacetate isomerase [Alphaproteobacteria bacterium]|nr:maleylacetoacetate isomerase [Alphaproteobacteria bacterium]
MKLYGYFRSSAAFRVRIALNLKGLEYDTELVNLSTGDHLSDDFRRINPQGRVPALVVDGNVLLQSPAIMEYLEETNPTPALLPKGPEARVRVRAIANIVACDIHPLNNLAILNYLSGPLAASDDQKTTWYRHWVAEGFNAVEPLLAGSSDTGKFCHGDIPGIADICLVPQVFNAQRFGCDLSAYPTIERVFSACMEHEAFDAAQPSKQPEAANIA